MGRKLAVAVLGAIAVALFATGCGSSSRSDSTSSDKFQLGLEAPLTGDQSAIGQGMLKGAQLAASQLNEQGGIDGKQVEVVAIDDKADPDSGVQAANAAIDKGLDGIVGPYNSGVGVKTLPLYKKAGLVPIRLTSDNSTDGMGFTLQPMSDQIAPVATKALTKWQSARKVAIGYDPTQNYTISVAKSIKALLQKAGVKVTTFLKVQPGEKNYEPAINKLSANDPDVIYAAVYYPEGGLIAKEMHAAKSAPQCIADYASYDTGFVDTAGIPAAKDCPVVGVPAPSDFPGSADNVSAYRAKFNQLPGTWSPYTYDSVNFLANGIKQAGGTDSSKLEQTLDGVRGWKGWTGSVTIDPKTGNRRPATVVVADTNSSGNLHVDTSWANAVGAPY